MVTLSTEVYIHDKVDAREVWEYCNELIGATPTVRFTEDESGFHNGIGQGFSALLSVSRSDGEPEAHDEWCDEDCSGKYHKLAHWVLVDFDTGYSYRGDNGEGCGDLHALLVAKLGKWLDAKGLRWSWRNEFTGDVHQSYDGLSELGSGGREASSWFFNTVLPVIAAEAAANGGEVVL